MGFIVVAAVIMVLGLLYALRAVFLVCQGTEDETAFFDQVLLSVPMVALSECARQAEAMLETARKSLETALGLFQQYRRKRSGSAGEAVGAGPVRGEAKWLSLPKFPAATCRRRTF